MRLRKLRLQNLNSLRCDKPIEIDLAEGPIGQAGIFAITGETGWLCTKASVSRA